MAYVGTPSRLGSARDTLASIIQGEAGGEGLRGMQAVGGVIANRAATNFSGYGSDPVSQATARMQFQGQSSNPSANAYRVADDVLSGQNPDPTGGALYYANPGDSSARWARNLDSSNSLVIGNHYFTDNTKGVPFSGGTSFSSGSTAPMQSTNPTDYSNQSGLSAPGTVGGFSNPNVTGNYYYNDKTGVVTPTTDQNPPGTSEGFGIIDADKGMLYGAGTGPAASSGGVLGAGGGGGSVAGFDSTGGFTSLNAGGGLSAQSTGFSGLSQPGVNASQYSLQGATLDQGVSAQSITGGAGGAGSADNIAGWNSAGPVTTNPAVVGAINTSGQKVSTSVDKGAKQIGDDTKEAGKTIGQSVTGLSGQLKGISDSWQALGKDYFVRLAFIVVGLIALAAGLMLFKPVQNAVGGVASKLPGV